MTNYKTGTVAKATVRGQRDVLVVRTGDCWHTPEAVGLWHTHLDGALTDIRPLVVLDLDEAYGCSAAKGNPATIVRALRETNSVAAHVIADQIEEQTKPPKPAEPNGLGAVIEDAKGNSWVRAGRSDHVALRSCWRCVDGEMVGDWSVFDRIDVVKVLSEGVDV